VRRLAALIALLAAAVPATAQAHDSRVRWIELTPGTSSSVRSLTFNHGSGTHRMTVIAYFGRVTRTRLFLDHFTFRYTHVDPRCFHGGKAFVWNSNAQLALRADEGRTYCRNRSFRLPIRRTFRGGQSNGKASVALQKVTLGSYWCTDLACSAHRSNVVFYVR
jgi:hypothetical protein